MNLHATARVDSRRENWLHLCADGLAYGSSIAMMLRSETDHLAFSRVLAKLTFLEQEDAIELSSLTEVNEAIARSTLPPTPLDRFPPCYWLLA
jgi:hypothetical protein